MAGPGPGRKACAEMDMSHLLETKLVEGSGAAPGGGIRSRYGGLRSGGVCHERLPG